MLCIFKITDILSGCVFLFCFKTLLLSTVERPEQTGMRAPQGAWRDTLRCAGAVGRRGAPRLREEQQAQALQRFIYGAHTPSALLETAALEQTCCCTVQLAVARHVPFSLSQN